MPMTPEQQAEIGKRRNITETTRRATVPALEEILYEAISVLDHGFVRVIDYMGDDSAVVQAARVSYGVGTKQTSDDRGLIRYLMRHRHSTPFEMCELKLHVKLPIFVARQWVRHRTANINEYSARYSILDKEFYVPDFAFFAAGKLGDQFRKEGEKTGQKHLAELFRLDLKEAASQSTTNKQGREEFLSDDEARDAISIIKSESARAYTNYAKLLNEEGGKKLDEGKKGLARELARIVLPTNFYTQWYWKIDLHNLLHFLSLRADPHAQYEIRAYAECISDIARKWVPHTWAAFEDYRQGGVQLSESALAVVKRLTAGEAVDQADSGMTKREWTELMETLGRGD
jgi:thymidylate synthase (FAD)